MKGMLTLAATIALATSPVAAQQDVVRQAFPYIADRLEVEVVADAPGTVQLMRGQPGQVEVAARAASGFPGASLAPRSPGRLLLGAVGATRSEYLVVVPENVRVTLRLPDRHLAEVFGTQQDAARYDWTDAAPAAAAAEAVSPVADGPPLVVTYAADDTPRSVTIVEDAALRGVTVRWEGDRFLIAADRPLALEPGDPERIEIRPAGEPIELVVVLPRGTADFVLELGADRVLRLDRGAAAVLCKPAIDQRLDEQRRWFTFSPGQPRDCGTVSSTDPNGGTP